MLEWFKLINYGKNAKILDVGGVAQWESRGVAFIFTLSNTPRWQVRFLPPPPGLPSESSSPGHDKASEDWRQPSRWGKTMPALEPTAEDIGGSSRRQPHISGKELKETTEIRVPSQRSLHRYHYILGRYLGPSLLEKLAHPTLSIGD